MDSTEDQILTRSAQRLPRGVPTPALLAVLCILAALPLAAYATMPEGPTVFDSSALRGTSRRDPPENLRSPRAFHAVVATAARTLIRAAGGASACALLGVGSCESAAGQGVARVTPAGVAKAVPTPREALIDLPPPVR